MNNVTKLDDRKCCICDGHIEPLRNDSGEVVWEGGNNALPVHDGRGCDNCNMTVVIPARIAMGSVNMFGAPAELTKHFDVPRREAVDIVGDWMKSKVVNNGS